MPDNLNPEDRRKAMRAVKGSNTSLERAVDAAFQERGWTCQRHVAELPANRTSCSLKRGSWYSWTGISGTAGASRSGATSWTPYWKTKIARTRRRDLAHFRRLRRLGWRVLRLWGHQVEKDLPGAVRRVAVLLRQTLNKEPRTQ